MLRSKQEALRPLALAVGLVVVIPAVALVAGTPSALGATVVIDKGHKKWSQSPGVYASGRAPAGTDAIIFKISLEPPPILNLYIQWDVHCQKGNRRRGGHGDIDDVRPPAEVKFPVSMRNPDFCRVSVQANTNELGGYYNFWRYKLLAQR